MKFYPTLQETLARRFDDISECQDIVNHGINSGFNGFIYNYEINEFFNEFESEIEDMIEDCGLSVSEFASSCDTFQELRIKGVWFVVEEFCHRKVDLIEAA